MSAHRWAIVLAAGQGRRLRGLTRVGSDPVPKQYCGLDDDVSLLRRALRRAFSVVASDRVLAIVAREHRRWFEPQLTDLPADNVVVQPRDRGTAAGILLPLLRILERDPDAEVLVLPSDHFVGDEEILAGAMSRAFAAIQQCPDRVVLLGVQPHTVDADLGWIVPRKVAAAADHRPVERFREKPDLSEAKALFAAGAAVNTFIFAAKGETLVRLYRDLLPELWQPFHALPRWTAAAVASLYRTLPVRDFSRDLLEPAAGRLRLLTAPDCGWSDLGTPQRVASCLGAAIDRPRATRVETGGQHVPLRLSVRLAEVGAAP